MERYPGSTGGKDLNRRPVPPCSEGSMTSGSPQATPETLLVHYTDLAGFLRQIEVPGKNLEDRFVAAFDGSSVFGFAAIEKSDMLLEAVRETLREVPWAPGVYRVITRVYKPDMTRAPVDPRLQAERALEYSLELGFKPLMGAELEFFLFDEVSVDVGNLLSGVGYSVYSREQPWVSDGPAPMVKLAYHMAEPVDKIARFRLELRKALKAFGYEVPASHHEVAVAQMEASLTPGDPVFLADEFVTFKWVARVVAEQLGLKANFMPKPIYGDNGSGLHIHASLWDREGKENLFAGEEGLSDVARHFIAGILEHARSLSALVSPTTNSYRRLVPGYEAPVYVAWGHYNRSALIRIPATKGNPKATRIELRSPDPTVNPYLAFAAVLMAGLDGVKKKLEPPEPYEGNLYKLTPDKLRELGIKTLPRSLDEALDELESDNEYLKPAFTKEALEAYIEIKRAEAEKVRLIPHPYEFYLYQAL